MREEDYISLCHYYKKERENPYEHGKDQNKAMLWSLERLWVESELSPEINLLNTFDEYKSKGLLYFSKDNVPERLKAVIFMGFMKTSVDGNIQPFIDFYKMYYR